MGWSKLAAAIGEFGFPVIMALGMGYFIWYVWKVITIDIKPALGKLFGMKTATCVTLTKVRSQDGAELENLKSSFNTIFNDKYNEH